MFLNNYSFLHLVAAPTITRALSLANLLGVDSLYFWLNLSLNESWLLFAHNTYSNSYELWLLILCFSLCNNSGQTAADLALACGFLECAKFLKTIQHTQTMKLRGQSSSSLNGNHSTLSEDLAAQEQEWEVSRSTSRKRRRLDGV